MTKVEEQLSATMFAAYARLSSPSSPHYITGEERLSTAIRQFVITEHAIDAARAEDTGLYDFLRANVKEFSTLGQWGCLAVPIPLPDGRMCHLHQFDFGDSYPAVSKDPENTQVLPILEDIAQLIGAADPTLSVDIIDSSMIRLMKDTNISIIIPTFFCYVGSIHAQNFYNRHAQKWDTTPEIDYRLTTVGVGTSRNVLIRWLMSRLDFNILDAAWTVGIMIDCHAKKFVRRSRDGWSEHFEGLLKDLRDRAYSYRHLSPEQKEQIVFEVNRVLDSTGETSYMSLFTDAIVPSAMTERSMS